MGIDQDAIETLSATPPPRLVTRDAVLRPVKEARERFVALNEEFRLGLKMPQNILALNAQLDLMEKIAAHEGVDIPLPAAASVPNTPVQVVKPTPIAPSSAPKKQDALELTGLDRVQAAFASQAKASSFAKHQAASDVPPFIATATLVKIASTVYGYRAQPANNLPEPQLREACARIIFQGHGTYPGCEADFSQLSAKNVFRPELRGMARTEAAFRQNKINDMLQGKP